jgi:glucose-1-phosphate adenylyltransferase
VTGISSVQSYLRNTLTVILAGGKGERLYPLTRDRAKPSVPFGGTYRIIDFTLSNCLNSGLRKIYLLTQYKSISLTRHISFAWNIFAGELDEFVETIPPQQRSAETWYHGTADAIFQNIYTLQEHRPERVLVLSGDHIYKMNYLDMLLFHEQTGAEITVACVEQNMEAAALKLGVVESDADQRIVGFEEKPAKPKPAPHDPGKVYCNMGVYVFNTETLIRTLVDDAKRVDTKHDFGKDIIPREIRRRKVFAYDFRDENRKGVQYWRDIGTIDAYYEANMDLVAVEPVFNLYDTKWPIRTYHPQYPPAKTVFADEYEGGRTAQVLDSLVSSGCIISGARIVRSILSPGIFVAEHALIENSIIMNRVRVGQGAIVKNAIIDKGVVVPPGFQIGVDKEEDKKRFTISTGGVVVIPKDMKIW